MKKGFYMLPKWFTFMLELMCLFVVYSSLDPTLPFLRWLLVFASIVGIIWLNYDQGEDAGIKNTIQYFRNKGWLNSEFDEDQAKREEK